MAFTFFQFCTGGPSGPLMNTIEHPIEIEKSKLARVLMSRMAYAVYHGVKFLEDLRYSRVEKQGKR